jgi:RNA polymerase sigma factor (sigma-70 family)
MNDSAAPGPREFATTRWSLVREADPGEAGHTRAKRALEELCRAYWYPLYAFARSRGNAPHDAQDLTQAFLARLLETGGFAGADPERGRFRSWLLGAMKHFLANEWHRAKAQKRGGQVAFLEWDALTPEARYALEPIPPTEPEILYDRQWALESVRRALESLRSEIETAGKIELFEALKSSLTGDEPSRPELAAELGMTEGAVKVAIHRLRQRFRDALRAEIVETVDDPAEIDAEMRHLAAILRGH